MKTIEQLPLTPKQQRFCDEYLTDLNATRAAMRAGYTNATAMNGKLMQIPKIKAYIKLRTKKAAKKLEVSRDEILAELCRVAFANMGDYFDDNGQVKPMHLLTANQKAAIWNIKVSQDDKGSTLQLRLNNKLTALEKIAKHIGFYDGITKEPEVEYVYLDNNDMDEYDRFEDESLAVAKKAEPVAKASDDDDDDDEEEEKDANWERDKMLYMEQELERYTEEVKAQKERARREAEADGDKQWIARHLKVPVSEEAVAGAVAGAVAVEGMVAEGVVAGAVAVVVEEAVAVAGAVEGMVAEGVVAEAVAVEGMATPEAVAVEGMAAEAVPEQKAEPVNTQFYVRGALTGKRVSDEVLKERRLQREYATGRKWVKHRS